MSLKEEMDEALGVAHRWAMGGRVGMQSGGVPRQEQQHTGGAYPDEEWSYPRDAMGNFVPQWQEPAAEQMAASAPSVRHGGPRPPVRYYADPPEPDPLTQMTEAAASAERNLQDTQLTQAWLRNRQNQGRWQPDQQQAENDASIARRLDAEDAQIAAAQQARAAQEARRRYAESGGNAWTAFGEGARGALSFEFDDELLSALDTALNWSDPTTYAERVAKRRERKADAWAAHPVANFTGGMLGSVAPYSLAGRAGLTAMSRLARSPYADAAGAPGRALASLADSVAYTVPAALGSGTGTLGERAEQAAEFASTPIGGGGILLGAIPGPGPRRAGAAGLAGAALNALPGVADPVAQAMFLGTHAANANMRGLQRAGDMLMRGATPEDTWRQTGWYRGADGEWRFEIDDSRSGVKEGVWQAIAPDPITGRPPQRVDPITGQSSAVGEQTMRLGEVLDHPTLFENYSDLADVPVVFKTLPPGTKGGWAVPEPAHGFREEIHIDPDQFDGPGDLRGTLLHELQHAVQAREGFSPGASSRLPEVQAHARAMWGEMQRDARRVYGEKTLVQQQWIEQFLGKPIRTMTPAELDRGKQMYRQRFRREADAIEAAFNTGYVQRAVPRDVVRAAYLRQYGEWEARNTQQGRIDLTAEERAAQFPEATTDVPVDELRTRPARPLIPTQGQPRLPFSSDDPDIRSKDALEIGGEEDALADIVQRWGRPQRQEIQESFAGVGARTADRQMLDRAGQMEAAGAPAEDIWRETGWERGVDGVWRFEISDENARLKLSGADLLPRGNRWEAGHLVGEVLEHPDLFAAYPDLAERSLTVRQMAPGYTAAYMPPRRGIPTDEFEVNSAFIDAEEPEEIIKAIMHEVGGHGIQTREGFAPGGSWNTPEVQAAARTAWRADKQKYEGLRNRREAWMEDFLGTPGQAIPYGPEYARAYRAYREAFPDDLQTEQALLPFYASQTVPREYNTAAYHRLAGEADARNVEDRLRLTAAERRRQTPGSTVSVPRDEQIILPPGPRVPGYAGGGRITPPVDDDLLDVIRKYAKGGRIGMAPGGSIGRRPRVPGPGAVDVRLPAVPAITRSPAQSEALQRLLPAAPPDMVVDPLTGRMVPAEAPAAPPVPRDVPFVTGLAPVTEGGMLVPPRLPPAAPLRSGTRPGPAISASPRRAGADVVRPPLVTPSGAPLRPRAGMGPREPLLEGRTHAPGDRFLGAFRGANPAPSEHGISQRNPTAITRQQDPLTERLLIGTREMELDPVRYRHNARLLATYPGVRISPDAPPEEIVRAFQNHVEGNLEFLYNHFPEEWRGPSQRWYIGANVIAHDIARDFNVTPQSAAAMIAALSPKREWYQNVDAAYRLANTLRTAREVPTTVLDLTGREIPDSMRRYRPERFQGMRLEDVPNAPRLRSEYPKPGQLERAILRDEALWAYMYDLVNNRERGYRTVTPEGQFGRMVTVAGGAERATGAASLDQIGKAIRAFRSGGNRDEISDIMGEGHKIRSFYNLIIDPNSPMGEVVSDTHYVAAGQMRPLGLGDTEVMHNFGDTPEIANRPPDWPGGALSSERTGVSGTYGFQVDPARSVAIREGALPRGVQSTTWEAIRSLWSPAQKGDPNLRAAVEAIWRTEADPNTARQRIFKLPLVDEEGVERVRGFRRPTWLTE